MDAGIDVNVLMPKPADTGAPKGSVINYDYINFLLNCQHLYQLKHNALLHPLLKSTPKPTQHCMSSEVDYHLFD